MTRAPTPAAARRGASLATVPRLGRLLLALLLLAFGTAHAQEVCREELGAAMPEGAPPVRVATALARTALQSLEPALPTDRGTSRAWEDPHAEWLQRRGYLPNGWDEDAELTGERWASLLANLQTPYRVEPRPTSGGTDPATLLEETVAALSASAGAVRPLALVATTPGDRSEVAFAAVIWNWTAWPRLLVFEPEPLAFGPDGAIEPLLADLGTCAWTPRAYLATDADTAANYYLGNDEARMEILATDASAAREPVPEGEERAVLAFESPLLEGARVAAIGFTGPGPSVGQLAGLLTSVRTNVGVFDLGRYLAFP